MVVHSFHPLLVFGIAILSGAMLVHAPMSTPSPQSPMFDDASSEQLLDGAIPVSAGTTLTIWEQTTVISERVFDVADVLGVGISFFTSASLSEVYWVSSDGTTLTIYCYKVPPEPMSGIGTGNNIVAVRLDGVPEYPNGLYASVIVSYVVGTGGVEESRWNALGPEDQVGPYLGLPYTSMGDYGSELVLAFTYVETETIEATVDIDPDVLNPKSNGNWITCYIELPSGYDVEDIAFESILLNGAVQADPRHSAECGDTDGDDISDVMVKFDRAAVMSEITPGQSVEIVVTGLLVDGGAFSGTDQITVLDKAPKT